MLATVEGTSHRGRERALEDAAKLTAHSAGVGLLHDPVEPERSRDDPSLRRPTVSPRKVSRSTAVNVRAEGRVRNWVSWPKGLGADRRWA